MLRLIVSQPPLDTRQSALDRCPRPPSMDIFHVTYLRLLWSVLLLSSFAAAVIVALLFLCTHLNGVGESTSLGVGKWEVELDLEQVLPRRAAATSNSSKPIRTHAHTDTPTRTHTQ